MNAVYATLPFEKEERYIPGNGACVRYIYIDMYISLSIKDRCRFDSWGGLSQQYTNCVCMATGNDNSSSRLAINRSSNKITKKANAMARPAPKLYNIHPSGFRELVQELTGNSFEPEMLQLPKPPPSPPKPPLLPPPPPPPAANFNSRLQKFAPPPLSSDAGPLVSSLPANDGDLKFDLFSPSFFPGIFSPLTAFTPMEWPWSEDRSPASMEYKQLAASLLEQAEKSPSDEAIALSPSAFRQDSNARPPVTSSGWGSPVSSPYFLYSPRCGNLSPNFGLSSPGSFAGFDLETI